MKGRRRVRLTIRCYQEDFGLPLPPAHVELLPDDRVIGSVVSGAPTYPEGLKRILCVEKPLVYRIRFSRSRAAAWLEDELGLIWVLAAGSRKDGSSSEDFYSHVERLHKTGRLLPTHDDYARDELESGARLLKALPDEIAYIVLCARDHPGIDFAALLGGRVGVRICVESGDGLETIWAAVACLDTQAQAVRPAVRDVIFAHSKTCSPLPSGKRSARGEEALPSSTTSPADTP